MAESSGSANDTSRSVFWSSDERFWKIIDSALDAVITMDAAGCVVDWNQQAEAVFGWSHADVVGQRLDKLIIPPQFRPQHQKGLQRFLATGQSDILNRRLEMTALDRSGREFPVELSISAVEIQGEPFFNAFLRDISSQKDAERRIARQSLETRLLHQASVLSATSHSFDDALRFCVANLGEIVNWPVGHALIRNKTGDRLVSAEIWHVANGRTFRQLRLATAQASFAIGEDLPGRVWKSGEAAWITEITQDNNITRIDDPSQLRVRSAFAFPVKTEGSVVAVIEFFHVDAISPDPHLLSLARGVGEQLGRVIEGMKLQEERTRLAAIVDSSGDAIIGKGLDGIITSWNAGAEVVYSWPAEEAVGQAINIILPMGVSREEPEILEAIQNGLRLEQFETCRRRRDGVVIDVAISVSPIRDHEGRIVGSSTIERDITARLRRERELAEARDAAEEANRVRGEFLANVSHELRTPMNAILGMLELALQEEITPGLQDYLQTAKDSADSLLLLVNDILDFSRLEAGRFELDPVPFNLRDMLDDAVKTLSLRAHEKGLELACHVGRDVPSRVVGDPMRLRQIVTNLAGNAIKFTAQGEVVVDVKLGKQAGQDTQKHEATPAPGAEIRLDFCVSDTGVGIAREDQERIFAPFTQADASTTRKHTGTGLGLAICHELTHLMQGDLWLESVPEKGSRFYFSVMLSVAQRDEAESQREQVTVNELKELPVLVVDDNQTNRTILEEMLSNWSMAPTVVETADDALQELDEAAQNEQQYPLVIVDALMPETDGFMFIEQAQEAGMLDAATILMLSSADRQVFNQRCDDLEINAYLEKPVSQSDLLDTIMTALKGPQLEQESVQRISRTWRTLNVLVAEDTPANQKVIAAVLKKRGHRCVIANNGREAIERLQNESFDAVLMDVQMPMIDGLQATAAIRQAETDSDTHVPIIAMTAHAMRGDREKCLAAGMDAYIAKPIDTEKLLRLLEGLAHSSERSQWGTSAIERPFETSAAERSKASDAQSVIDMQAAKQRVGGDTALLSNMVDFFFEDAPELLQQIQSCAAGGDAEELTRAAHSLKGLCANFDAEAATRAALVIEKIGRTGDLSTVGPAIELLETELDRLERELKLWQADNS